MIEPALPGRPSQDELSYWLARLSEALHRMNNGLLWAGSSPGELERVLSAPEFPGSPLAIDVAHAAACMRRFADQVFEPDPKPVAAAASVWADLMMALRVLLDACAEESELWLAGWGAELPNPLVVRELRAAVHAVERLCGHFERIH